MIAVEIAVRLRRMTNCQAKIAHYVEYEAYMDYDKVGVRTRRDPNRLTAEQRTAVNGAMRARSPRDAWEPFLNRPLDELAAIPTDVDLVDSDDAAVDPALASLKAALQPLCDTPGITDVAATKMLHLKRPRLVAISDAYVREQLGIAAPQGPDRAILVAQAIRKVGRDNAEALSELHSFANSVTDPKGAPVILSKARILDILLWVQQSLESRTKLWRALARSYPRDS